MMKDPSSGLLAEFESAHALLEALRNLRSEGYARLEAYSPFAIEGVDEVLGRTRSRVPGAILLGGICGAAGAYYLEWLTNAYLYPLRVGGRPPHFPLAYVPITFEMGVLLASLTAFFGVLVAGRLLRLWRPQDEVEAFLSCTVDRFWIAVDARDARFAPQATARSLHECGAMRVEPFGGVGPLRSEP